ncbi:MAG: TatD family hydrolase [Candidatus Riflemargulisbacteria bacterium]
MSLIDTHIHLTDSRYSEIDLESVINKAKSFGVTRLITLGIDLEDSKRAAELAESYECIYFCAGIHPHEADKFKKEDMSEISKLLKHNKCVGVGEIGLDFYYEHSQVVAQLEVFKRMIALANQGKPIVLHTRSAEKEVLDIIKETPGKYHCHSYAGDSNLIEGYLRAGAFFSFNGMITFKGAQNVREIAKKVPLDKILVESDGPYLAPIPYRGKINLPEYLKTTVEFLSEMLGLSYDEMESITTKNAERFFWDDI